jgi:hypothetical protein
MLVFSADVETSLHNCGVILLIFMLILVPHKFIILSIYRLNWYKICLGPLVPQFAYCNWICNDTYYILGSD